MDDVMMKRAKLGYEAYGKFTEWKNYAGMPMPAWDDLTDRIRDAWREATIAIVASTEPAMGTTAP